MGGDGVGAVEGAAVEVRQQRGEGVWAGGGHVEQAGRVGGRGLGGEDEARAPEGGAGEEGGGADFVAGVVGGAEEFEFGEGGGLGGERGGGQEERACGRVVGSWVGEVGRAWVVQEEG